LRRRSSSAFSSSSDMGFSFRPFPPRGCYVDRIPKDEKPADLPVEVPAEY
jgi:hypothetical protein